MQITSLNKLTKKNIIFHDAVVNKYDNKSIKIQIAGRRLRYLYYPFKEDTEDTHTFFTQKGSIKVNDIFVKPLATLFPSDDEEED